jgi:hypothetical protein
MMHVHRQTFDIFYSHQQAIIYFFIKSKEKIPYQKT